MSQIRTLATLCPHFGQATQLLRLASPASTVTPRSTGLIYMAANKSHHFPHNVKRLVDQCILGVLGGETVGLPFLAECFDGPFAIGSASYHDVAGVGGPLPP